MESPFVVPVVFFLSMAAIFIMRGPLGKALADRVAGRTGLPADGHTSAPVMEELEELRRRVGELEERVDFAERLLAQGRDAGRVGPGR